MDHQDERSDAEVIDRLVNMFKDVMNEDAIYAVVESCGGDLNMSVDVIMDITKENNTTDSDQQTRESDHQTHDSDQQTYSLPINNEVQPPNPTIISYSNVSKSTGTVPKQATKLKTNKHSGLWTDQIHRIILNHTQGNRIAILMRGVPGSGKSYLAKSLIEMTIGNNITDYKTHIFSSDDYFVSRGVYQYDKFKLSEAHTWNQNRVRAAMRQGLSPVIVDNTNIEIWEMEPYAREAVANGYIIEVVEPNTPWAKKVSQLSRRNTHNVPITKIRRMLDNYQDNVTSDILMNYYNLSYPPDMIPPVIRTVPALPKIDVAVDISNQHTPSNTIDTTKIENPEIHKNNSVFDLENTGREYHETILDTCESSYISQENVTNIGNVCDYSQEHVLGNNITIIPNIEDIDTINLVSSIASGNGQVNDMEVEELSSEVEKQQIYVEVQKQLEEMEKVEREWDNGEDWNDNTKETINSRNELSLEPKPPRNINVSVPSKNNVENLLDNVNNCKDWTQISLFMPPWKNENSTDHTPKSPQRVVETISSSTCVEAGDADIVTVSDKYKIITATPRDINISYLPLNSEKIPEKRMFDKSSMTNDPQVTEIFKCKNEENHFEAFTKLFRNVPQPILKDIFDNCHGNVNWAVDLVLDGIANKQFELVTNESPPHFDYKELCDCVTAYNTIPDIGPMDHIHSTDNQPSSADLTTQWQRKVKKEKFTNDSSIQLKRQIEQNIVISDNHYSDNCLRIRKIRRGEVPHRESFDLNEVLEENHQNVNRKDENLHNTSETIVADMSVGENIYNIDDEDNINVEKNVTINMGSEFISQLDNLFGRKDMIYPSNIIPKISMPLSLLSEINALWMESLMDQLDKEAKSSALMIQQDEDFARQLAMKEAELAQAGKEPEVPDFKEIMDMDFAMSLYYKDVAEWRNNEPKDLAAKMSRDKLFNLFPEVTPEILSELLMAHDNNFLATVEVLLMTTGRSEVLAEKNGLNKYIMEKEMERQEKLLKEEEKVLSEVEWPLLSKGERVEMSTVNDYREQAERHLQRRNMNYQKAQDYIRRGMTQVANYYSDIATYHKKMYEQANSLAAVSLVQVHAANCSNNSTIDLHFLRVAEARESLDLFLDKHITKLKETQNAGGLKYHTLFFITGRGLHSVGGPRVKPAIKKRLRERGLSYCERNPGLLTTRVSAENKLTYQIP